MKSGSVAVVMAAAVVMMSVGEAALIWKGCPYLCSDICGGTTDKICAAACERQFCILSPTPAPTPVPTPAGEADSDLWSDCPFLCSKVCGGLVDKSCTAACQKLYCIMPPAPVTVQPDMPGDI